MISYKELAAYQKSYALVLEVYKVARTFPREETFALASQIKRAAYSIPLNIAEGYGKNESVDEFKRYLRIAVGSSDEMKVLTDLCYDLGFLNKEQHRLFSEGYVEVGKILTGMIQKWR